MRIFTDETGLQHIGKDSTERTLCHMHTEDLRGGVAIDVHRVRPLETPGITPHFCTSCHSNFSGMVAKGRVQNFFWVDDVLTLRDSFLEDMTVIYRGPSLNRDYEGAVVYNPKSGAQFVVPYSRLSFTEG